MRYTRHQTAPEMLICHAWLQVKRQKPVDQVPEVNQHRAPAFDSFGRATVPQSRGGFGSASLSLSSQSVLSEGGLSREPFGS